ncbi:choline/ethanolamine kinase [Ectocarpus siliculosus]|uniref:Choline/ethanolamine kinase n=1 Tax=Ectocarpus siliculosus TaxID=2880 RepID=D8LN91_ECTSI|nr:choline/ethanolamine kinase [Ectocarpus siliculosus]|eukprot:CBN79735.1 choline/ethanolamine kinase [Ectocarpus siliculosus]
MATAAAAREAMPLVRLDLGSLPEAGASLSEHVKLAALRALRATTPGWRDSENDHERREEMASGFSMRALTGGMTNTVFRCSKPGGENQTVLLRSYGKGTEMFFSREAELRAFKLLAERGFGPDLLATLGDGRVEQFLEGRSLGAMDMRKPAISTLIARRMSELHALDIDVGSRTPVIFGALESFHAKALQLCGDVHGGVDVVELGGLATLLRERLESRVPSKVVFCHNDLQSGNILYNDKSSASAKIPPKLSGPTESPRPVVSLIDYEYAGYNPRGFDVGNHFCEWMADYSTAEPHVLDLERYPSPQERRAFSRAYLGAMNGVPHEEVNADEVENLVKEADAYSLASHLLWAMWALLQSKARESSKGCFSVAFGRDACNVLSSSHEKPRP